MSKQVTKRMQKSIHKYGPTICSNGWDNIAWHPLLNVMLACPSGDVFIGSIDITRKWKDAHYTCNGLDNIIYICTNTVSSMKNVVDLLIHYFPSLYFQGCVAHCLDLLLENWGKTTWVKQIVKKAKVVLSFIRQHHAPFAIFRHYGTNLLLLNPTETRFVTKFLMVERLNLPLSKLLPILIGQLLSTHCVALITRSCSPRRKSFKPT